MTNHEKIANNELMKDKRIQINFTKEELGIIFCNLCVNPKTKDILLKIHTMFDNYCESNCEHKWIKCFYGEQSIPINLCELCNFREKR